MSYYLYAGTYTGGDLSDHKDTASEGIYCFALDSAKGELSDSRVYGDMEIDPGFVAVRGRYLFAENERRDMGTVRAFRIGGDGSLSLIDKIESEGSKCAFIYTDQFGPYVFATNYASGSVMVMRFADEELTLTDQVQHYGSSVVPIRQECPRAHSVKQTPDGNGIIVPDLGIDKIMRYRLDRETGQIAPNQSQPFVEVDPGEGPRHLVIHPSGKYIYVNTEIGNHIYVYSFNAVIGVMTQIQKISLLPNDYSGVSHSSEIIISSSGEYIYVGNRGHDTITSYHVDEKTGLLEVVGWFESGGKDPRHIAFAPNESYIICANKDSDEITIIERDRKSGELGKIRYKYHVPAPSCVVWCKAGE